MVVHWRVGLSLRLVSPAAKHRRQRKMQRPNVPQWMKTPGDPMGSQLYGLPSPFGKNVIKSIPKNLSQYFSASGRTPLEDLDGIIMPNGTVL
jgi:hypothetical protein